MKPALWPPFLEPHGGYDHCCPAQSRTLSNAATPRYPWRCEMAMARAASPDPPVLAGSARVGSQQSLRTRCRCGLAPPATDRAPLASRHGQHSTERAAHATNSPPNPSQPSPYRPASAAEQYTRNRALSTHPCQPTPSWPALFKLTGRRSRATHTLPHRSRHRSCNARAVGPRACPVTAHGRSAALLRPGHVSPPPAGPHVSSSQDTPLMQRPAPRGIVRPLLAGPCMHKLRQGPGGNARLQPAVDAYSSQ